MDFKRPTKELIEELHKYDTSGFSDAFDEIGFYGVMTGVLPLTPGMKMVGPALTTLERDIRPTTKTIESGRAVDMCQPGDIFVIDADGAQAGTWGGLMTLRAKWKGLTGVIIDGCTRDAVEIRAENYPCWVTGVVPYSVVPRLTTLSINEMVMIRGVPVNPGDIILADDDGAIVCPQKLLDEVLPKVRRHYEWEQRAKEELRRGVTDAFKDRVT